MCCEYCRQKIIMKIEIIIIIIIIIIIMIMIIMMMIIIIIDLEKHLTIKNCDRTFLKYI